VLLRCPAETSPGQALSRLQPAQLQDPPVVDGGVWTAVPSVGTGGAEDIVFQGKAEGRTGGQRRQHLGHVLGEGLIVALPPKEAQAQDMVRPQNQLILFLERKSIKKNFSAFVIAC